MKSKHGQALEAHTLLPDVAWGMTFLFALFVYHITTELREITTDLQAQTEELRKNANTPVEEITDFEPKRSSR